MATVRQGAKDQETIHVRISSFLNAMHVKQENGAQTVTTHAPPIARMIAIKWMAFADRAKMDL